MKQVDLKVIRLEVNSEEEPYCPDCKLGVLFSLDNTHYKCSYCKSVIKKDDNRIK